MIIKPDPYIDNYVVEKTLDPQAPIVWKQYRKKYVDRVDHILELSHGSRESVKTFKDWEVVGELLNFFKEEWPNEFNEFRSSIVDIRGSRNADGYSSTREIQYVGAMPVRLMKMIQVVFPFQQFNKSFMAKFFRKFPIFKVAGVNNLSKGRSII